MVSQPGQESLSPLPRGLMPDHCGQCPPWDGSLCTGSQLIPGLREWGRLPCIDSSAECTVVLPVQGGKVSATPAFLVRKPRTPPEVESEGERGGGRTLATSLPLTWLGYHPGEE